MIATEKLPALIREKNVAERLAEICEGNSITFMGVFGSFARGEQKKNSDIDIAIEFDKNSRKSLLDLVHIEHELSKLFRKKVDLGILSSLSPYVVEDVKREMRVIYENNKLTEVNLDI